MFSSFKQYVTSLGLVLLAMLAYRWLFVPAIEPPIREKPTYVAFNNNLQTSQWWQRLFPADAWQQNQPRVLQTPRGILLCTDWTQIGPKEWRLEPLTMIIPQSQSDSGARDTDPDQTLADQDVWIVNADRGAVIQFRDPLDFTQGRTPPVVGGRLDGQINITRRAKNNTDERPWHLLTSDVQIDRRQIWTVKPVEIRWDNSIIRGRDLSILLKQDLLSNSADDASPWGVLEKMELIYIDEINVGLPPGGLWADMKQTSPKLPVVKGLPASLQVRSGGPFRFDFISSEALLMNGVHAAHQVGTLKPDVFSSQELKINLEPIKPGTTPDPSKPFVSLGGLQLKQLVASGMDPVGPLVGQTIVRVDAPNIGTGVTAKRLKVNFVDYQIELAGRLDGPQAASTVTRLDYLDYSFRAPSIGYKKAPGVDHLGWLVADGPGELMVAPTSDMGECNVRWQKSMTMNPDGTEERISLIGQTLIESKRHGFMTSETLDLWLKPNPAATSQANNTAQANDTAQSQFLPDRLRALGNVNLGSAQIKAAVNEMKLWLVHVPVVAPPADGPALPLADSAGNPMYQFVAPPAQQNESTTAHNQPALPTINTPIADNTANAANDARGPISVEGTVLQSKIIVTGKQSWIDTLTVDGPLKVLGAPTTTTSPPWNIDGDQLQLSTNSNGQASVQITGNMARIAMGETWLQGPIICYDQATGYIWMDQPGEFSIPTTTLNQMQGNGNANRDATSSVRWVKAPHCSWKGRLMFDGAVALIEGDIEMTGMFSPEENRFWSVKGNCQLMEIHLSNPINMQAPKAASASLDRVVLKDMVDIIAAQNDNIGNRLSLERIVVPVLTYHLPQSQIVGAGPGWIRSWHLASTKLGQMASSSSERVTPQAEIQGAHLSFRESMVAQMNTSEVRFQGKVELAAGPLKSWDDMIDLNTMQRLKPEEMLLNCDMLTAHDASDLGLRNSSLSQQRSATWEFQALGNVRFAGKTNDGDYSGHGYRVTYTQAKDLLVLEGDGRIPAHIRKEVAPNSREQNLEADVISAAINVKTMATQDVRITRVGIEAPTSQILGGSSGMQPVTPGGQGASQPLKSPASNIPDPRNPAWLRPKQ